MKSWQKWHDALYSDCETGEQIEGRMLWIKNQKSRALDAARTQYELFWICKLIEKFPGMSYQTARQEFSENSTQCIAMVMQGGGG